MKAPGRILVICTRRLGDVLLTTPLIHSLRLAWPQARIDVLVFAGTEGILKGNPDINAVLTVPERPSFGRHLRLAAHLFRRYHLAISTQPGDRPTLYAWLAGRRRIGFVDTGSGHRLKARMLKEAVAFDNLNTHTVALNLQLAAHLGIQPVARVVLPQAPALPVQALAGFPLNDTPYAVLHPFPKFAYKEWTEAGWLQLAAWLEARAVTVVLTGGPDPAEKAFADRLMQRLPGSAVNLVGQLTLAQTGALLSQALVYVGPDTATTHMAAAAGIPTVALFGPSNPVKWGPWPAGRQELANPWRMRGSQRRGNVVLVQGEGQCVPCLQEGCERHQASGSACLQNMTVQTVMEAVAAVLDRAAG